MQPLRRRGGHRRHALPRRLRDQRADPPGPRHPRRRPPADRGAARRRRPARRGARRSPHRRPAARRAHRVLDPRRDRPRDRPRRPQADHRRPAPRPQRRPRDRRGLGQDAGRGRPHRRPAVGRDHPRGPSRAGAGGGPRAAALARRRPLHLPRLPRVRAARGRLPRRRRRYRSRHPAGRPAPRDRREPPRQPLLRAAARRRPGQGPRAPAAGADQGEQPGHRAPALLPRLRRRQEVRRERQRRRRAALPRPVLLRRLHRVRAPGAGRAAQGGGGAGARRVLAQQPRRPGPAADPGDVPARRDVPDLRRGAGADRHLRALPPGAAPPAPLPAPGRVRPLLLGPRLPPPRPLHHRRPAADHRHPQGGARRHQRRLHGLEHRVHPVPPALRGPRPAGHRAAAPVRRRQGARRGPSRRGRPLLGRRVRRGAHRGVRRGARRGAAAPLRVRLPRGLQGRPRPALRGRRPRPPGAARRGEDLRAEPVRAGRRRPRGAAFQDLPEGRLGLPVGRAAGAQPARRRGHRRTALRAALRGPHHGLDLRLRPAHAQGPVRRHRVPRRRRPRARPGRLRRHLDRQGGERRLQRPRAQRRSDLARGDGAARVRQVPAAGRFDVQPGLHGGHPPQQRPHHAPAHQPVRGADGARAAAGRTGDRRRPARGDRRRARPGREPGRGPDPALLPHRHQRDAADELLPGGERRRAARLRLHEVRPAGHPGPARAASGVRDLGVLAARRGRPPALRQGRARWSALVGPARGLPHRDPRPGQGADGEEHRHRAGRRQGRLRRQAAARPERRPRRLDGRGHRQLQDVHLGAARHHRQHGGRRGRAPRRRRPARRGRHLPRRRRRQGHREVLRHRQRGRRVLQLLARRRLRLGRQRGLRPQGHGHHRPRRLGVRQAALPGAGRGHPDPGLHRRRHRRHVG